MLLVTIGGRGLFRSVTNFLADRDCPFVVPEMGLAMRASLPH